MAHLGGPHAAASPAPLSPPGVMPRCVGRPSLLIRVVGFTLDVVRGDGPVDLAFAAGPGIDRLISGEIASGWFQHGGDGRLAGRIGPTFAPRIQWFGQRLQFAPVAEPEAAILAGIRWLIDHNRLAVANPLR